MAKPVGKLRKINLNEVWANEVDGFASWLQQEEILEMLGEAVELSLKPAGEAPLEALVGGVLAKDTKRGHNVIILGHLEGISPEAFGKLIMYAAGLEAKAMICVGQEITADIRLSLNWLNMVSRDDVNFYAAELELWRIDDSVPAPNFNIVCEPNSWARQLKAGQEDGPSAEISPAQESTDVHPPKAESTKGSKDKGGAAQGKQGVGSKDGVSVRQNFVYTKTFS
ncbi:MAG: hypothetical protein OEZ57_02205 [Nitrospirota bacterium]|nr:hypothetical protein [Nitrospirota bacterium]MDH5585534.1 hypothetical protein [Nitrospirota bacterium]MDH5773715.1 hypothetical protein [Nitrospirota bacterium]